MNPVIVNRDLLFYGLGFKYDAKLMRRQKYSKELPTGTGTPGVDYRQKRTVQRMQCSNVLMSL